MKNAPRFARLLGTGFVAGVVGLALAAPAPAQGKQEKHPHLRKALRELREARKQLHEAAHAFGGFRAEAIVNTDVSIFLLEKAIQFDKGVKTKKVPGGGKTGPATPFKLGEGEKHPHVRQALHRLREARRHLLEATHDYGGFRAEAVRTIDVSIFLVEKGLQLEKR